MTAWAPAGEVYRDEQAFAWELRGYWARRTVISVRLQADVERARGRVAYVSPTGAFALLSGPEDEPLHVPCARILSIRRPHFTEPVDRPPPRRKPIELPPADQLPLFEVPSCG